MRKWIRDHRDSLGHGIGVLLSWVIVAGFDHRWSSMAPVSFLYVGPVLLAAAWFGYPGGLAGAITASGAYAVTHVLLMQGPVTVQFTVADMLRLTSFLVVGLATARLRASRESLARTARETAMRAAELHRVNRRLEEVSAARADLVAVAAHELKSPLTTILGSAEMLANESTDPERKQRLAAFVYQAAGQLERSVDVLLDTALYESGHSTLRLEPVPLQETVAEAIALLGRASVDRVTISPTNEEFVVPGDPDQLRHVLVNLLGNALKYSPLDSRVIVSISVERRVATLRVIDQGYGIASTDLPRIFERYYRSADGKVRSQRGAGLGLSVSRDIVRAHGGELLVESEPGKGSTFVVTLPLWRPETHLVGFLSKPTASHQRTARIDGSRSGTQ